MKQINDFEVALNYVLRLGFQGSRSNPIVIRQADLCNMVDLLLKAADGVYPYKAQFSTYKNEDTGYFYPYLGTFKIVRNDGTKWILNVSTNYFYKVDSFDA